ncbi:MAG: hypothetical protein IJR00_01330 [Lachnospiraceae bacterium]|nr:hypothetical protein [Lachnospiraceae bacterium]
MANIYVGQFKDVLKNYRVKELELQKQIDANNERFTQEYAEEANREIQAQQEQEYHNAVNLITKIYQNVRELISIASFPDVGMLTADRQIFESGIEMSVNTVRAFVERYEKPYNPTMLQYIKAWIDRQHEAEAAKQSNRMTMRGKYDDIKITSPRERVEVYKKFADSAIAIADKIRNHDLVLLEPLEIEHFTDERLTGKLLDVIGGGIELSDFKLKRTPESAKHSFDDVTLKTENKTDSAQATQSAA